MPHRLASGTPTPIPPRAEAFASRCLSIDLEIGRESRRIFQLAAVHGGTGETMTHRGGDVAKALRRLDAFAQGAEFLLGHNLIGFDVPHLEAANPELRLLELPCIDTLRLNPLAFPRNPYHHLVKHYQDGQLRRGRRNDPELDARLTLEVLTDQQRAFSQTAPDLLTAWHWLVGCGGHGAGHQAFFGSLGGAPSPTRSEAEGTISLDQGRTWTEFVVIEAQRSEAVPARVQ